MYISMPTSPRPVPLDACAMLGPRVRIWSLVSSERTYFNNLTLGGVQNSLASVQQHTGRRNQPGGVALLVARLSRWQWRSTLQNPL